MHSYILCDSSIPIPGGREFVRQCVNFLITSPNLIIQVLILVLCCFFILYSERR